MSTARAARSKLLFFVTEDYYFVSHRLPLAIAAKAAGYDVCVATRLRNCRDVIGNAGLRAIPFENARSSINPLLDIVTALRLIRLYRRERPDIVHHVALKPVLYGSLAARLSGVGSVVNALAGMGWLFTSGSGWARRLKPLVRRALKGAVKTGAVIVQNRDDERFIAELGVAPNRIHRIAGSGVDLTRFRYVAEPPGTPQVVLPARLLWDKGVGEFATAARLLHGRGVDARFVLAGEPDPANPASIDDDQVHAWVREGSIEYRGWIADMPPLLMESHIVVLPSYREGLPKTLIEAAAAGRPIVTTDVPGCRETVIAGETGLLVPPRNAAALADAIERLILDAPLRRRMGERGRQLAEREFGVAAVIEHTLDVYREVLS